MESRQQQSPHGSEAMTTKTTAAEAVQMQHESIKKAIELLQGQLDGMTDTVDPETASWKDVSIFAKTADLARALCEAHAS
tara:strand:+ start:596 stop:835 length:240 start_codon:yes stop_codon:yes gene_type:complete